MGELDKEHRAQMADDAVGAGLGIHARLRCSSLFTHRYGMRVKAELDKLLWIGFALSIP